MQNKNYENQQNQPASTGYHQYQQNILKQRNEIDSTRISTRTSQLSLDQRCSEYQIMNITLSAELLKTQQV